MSAPQRRGRGWRAAPVERGALAVMALGVAVAVWPPSATVPPARVPLPAVAAPPRLAGASAAATVDSVVRTNLFSARRQAPGVRYRDPLATAPAMPEATGIVKASADGGTAGGQDAAGMPRLLGVVHVEGERRALVQWAPGQAGWCPEGRGCEGRGGRAMARAITPTSVELVMAGQVRTLRLATGRPADSLSRMP